MLETHKAKGDRDTWYLTVTASAKTLEFGQPPFLLVCDDHGGHHTQEGGDRTRRSLCWLWTSQTVSSMSSSRQRLNPDTHVDQHHAPRVRVTRFLQQTRFLHHTHELITEVLILDELNYDFTESLTLLDVVSFANYDAFDQDLPDVSWIYLDTNVKGIGQTIRVLRLARTSHGYFHQDLCLLGLYTGPRSHEPYKKILILRMSQSYKKILIL